MHGGSDASGLIADKLIDPYLNPAELFPGGFEIYCGGSFDIDTATPTKFLYAPVNNFHFYLFNQFKRMNYSVQIDEKVLRSRMSTIRGTDFSRVKSIRSIINRDLTQKIRIGILFGYDYYDGKIDDDSYTEILDSTKIHSNDLTTASHFYRICLGATYKILNPIKIGFSYSYNKKADNGYVWDTGFSYPDYIYLRREETSLSNVQSYTYHFPEYAFRLKWRFNEKSSLSIYGNYQDLKYTTSKHIDSRSLDHYTQIDVSDIEYTQEENIITQEKNKIIRFGAGVSRVMNHFISLFCAISLIYSDRNSTKLSNTSFNPDQNQFECQEWIQYHFPLFVGLSFNFDNTKIILSSNYQFMKMKSSYWIQQGDFYWKDEDPSGWYSDHDDIRIGLINNILDRLKLYLYFSMYDSELKSDLFFQLKYTIK